jgi:hypothetical protein
VAVCVEENPRKDGLSVILAINKARPRDAEDVLDTTDYKGYLIYSGKYDIQ